MRLIDVEAAIERARKSDEIVGSSIWETSEVVEFLDDCPIVDAVEVVRCKDCKWRTTMGCPYMHFNAVPPDDFDFCSAGERRTNENH